MSEHKSRNPVTRREALRKMGNGFGMLAFAGMLGDSIARAGGVAGFAPSSFALFLTSSYTRNGSVRR